MAKVDLAGCTTIVGAGQGCGVHSKLGVWPHLPGTGTKYQEPIMYYKMYCTVKYYNITPGKRFQSSSKIAMNKYYYRRKNFWIPNFRIFVWRCIKPRGGSVKKIVLQLCHNCVIIPALLPWSCILVQYSCTVCFGNTAVQEKSLLGHTWKNRDMAVQEKKLARPYRGKSWHGRVHRENADTAVTQMYSNKYLVLR